MSESNVSRKIDNLRIGNDLNIKDDLTVGGDVSVTGTCGAGNTTITGTCGITGNTTLSANLLCNHVRYLTGNMSGLPVVEKNDPLTDSGFALAANTITNSAYDAGHDASAVTVASLSVGQIAVLRFGADVDGDKTIIITLASGQTFNAGSLNLPTQLAISYQTQFPTVGTGQGNKVIATSHKKISIKGTPNNNQTGKGSYLVFYCDATNKVSLGFGGVSMGNGTLNGTFATS